MFSLIIINRPGKFGSKFLLPTLISQYPWNTRVFGRIIAQDSVHVGWIKFNPGRFSAQENIIGKNQKTSTNFQKQKF